jgi:hypothetical protein
MTYLRYTVRDPGRYRPVRGFIVVRNQRSGGVEGDAGMEEKLWKKDSISTALSSHSTH